MTQFDIGTKPAAPQRPEFADDTECFRSFRSEAETTCIDLRRDAGTTRARAPEPEAIRDGWVSTVLASLIRASGWRLPCALFISVVSGLGGALLVALINEALTAEAETFRDLGWKFALLAVAVLGLRWASQLQFVQLSEWTLAHLRDRISRQIAEARFQHVEREGSARLLTVLTEDIGAVSFFFVALPELAMHAAIVLGCLLYLGFLSWQVFLFAVLMVLVGSLGYHLAHLRALHHLRAGRAHEDELFRHFRALFDGAKELKLNDARRRAFLDHTIHASISAVRDHRMHGMKISVASASWGSFSFFVLIGTVLFVLGRSLPPEAGVLSGYALMFLYMMLPLEAMLGAIPGINRARVALERIQRLQDDLGNEPVELPARPLAPFRSLSLASVTHSYHRDTEDGVFTLGPLDFEVTPGEVVFVVGGNGSGKTTLAKLLVGLYAPELGGVRLNGELVSDSERESYRQYFSAIFADFFLFERLLGIVPHGHGNLDQRAHELLVELDLDHKVRVHDGTFSTTELSQGQRKRLALVVAYLEDRPIYVFDEWAADQDPAYKRVFYERVLPGLKQRGKAVVVITHDDRYFAYADRCIELEFGKVASAWRPAGTERDRHADDTVGRLLDQATTRDAKARERASHDGAERVTVDERNV